MTSFRFSHFTTSWHCVKNPVRSSTPALERSLVTVNLYGWEYLHEDRVSHNVPDIARGLSHYVISIGGDNVVAARIMTEGVKRKEDAENLRLRVSWRNAYNPTIDLPVYYFLAEPEDYFMEVLFLELESHLDLECPLREGLKPIIRI